MQTDEGHRSRDVIDARGRAGGVGGGTAFALLRLGARFGWKGIAVALVALGGLYALNIVGSGVFGPDTGDHAEEFDRVSAVLDDVQASWDTAMPGYAHAQLVVFRGSTPTGCGYGNAATGPFYCPEDQRVYIDLAFFDALAARFGAPGDFAQAYVVAHEVGHHVQHLTGADRRAERGADGAGGAQVRLELQADCYAGVWAKSAAERRLLDPGDLDEGLRAAAAIGDDVLQRSSTGVVRPDAFTHGTSEQRVRWLRAGYDAGDPSACDTFGASRL